MVYCEIWCHSRWRGRKNLQVELRALLCPAPGPAKIKICWHTATTSDNAWLRPEPYEASFFCMTLLISSCSGQCNSRNPLFHYFTPCLVQNPSSLESGNAQVIKKLRIHAGCSVAGYDSSVHLQTDQVAIFPHLTARWLPSSLKQNRVSQIRVSEDQTVDTFN